MPTAVGSTTGTSGAGSASSSANIFGDMGSDTFLKLLVAQMKYQNPMSPSDPTAMMGQIATYAQVESLSKLQSLQASGNSLAETQIATSMIGQHVSAKDSSGAEVTGKVTAARFTDAGAILVLDTGAELTVSAVSRVGASVSSSPATTPAATTPAVTTPPAPTPAATTPAAPTPAVTTPAPTTDTGSSPASDSSGTGGSTTTTP